MVRLTALERRRLKDQNGVPILRALGAHMKRFLPVLVLVAAVSALAGAQTFIAFKVVVLW
jgi:hypothetical protein